VKISTSQTGFAGGRVERQRMQRAICFGIFLAANEAARRSKRCVSRSPPAKTSRCLPTAPSKRCARSGSKSAADSWLPNGLGHWSREIQASRRRRGARSREGGREVHGAHEAERTHAKRHKAFAKSAAQPVAAGVSTPLRSKAGCGDARLGRASRSRQKAADGNILVDLLPMNANATADQTPVGPLGRRSCQQTWIPLQRSGDTPAIRESNDDFIVRDFDIHRVGSDAGWCFRGQSAHSRQG
jgi:hypothetical protein